MKKKAQGNKNVDIAEVVTKIQEQLAVLDQKLDAFMTKSLNELAQVLAASKPVYQAPSAAPASHAPRSNDRPSRPMYAVVCFDCGKDTEIPFKPTGDRPVYCKECFTKRKGPSAKTVETKPQGFSIAPSSNVSGQIAGVTTAHVSEKKKEVKLKKSVAKKKTVVKKSAKRK